MKKVDLTKGNVLKVLMTLAIPIMASSFFQFAYNIIDMMWVGGLGSNAVASIGSSSFFISMGNAINAFVVIGTGIKVSHAIGGRNEKEVNEYIKLGILLNLLVGIIYCIIIVLFGRNFIGFLNINSPIVEEEGYKYLIINAPILFFTFFNTLFIRIFNSFGNNKSALIINIIGILINTILDPIFIYTLDLGVSGAEISSLIGTIVVFLMLLYNGRNIFKINLKEKIDFNKVKTITILGMPMSMQRVLFTFINIILARIVGGFGADAIAAQKIGLQIESIIYMVVGGLNGAITGFVGQNYGAKKYERINKGYNTATGIGAIYALIITVIFIFMPGVLVRLFVREESTVYIASNYLRIIGISQIFSTMEMISNGVFTGLGKPKIPATISIVFTALRIPMALIFIRFFGVNGIWISISLSSILKGITAYLIYKLRIGKEYNDVRCDKIT